MFDTKTLFELEILVLYYLPVLVEKKNKDQVKQLLDKNWPKMNMEDVKLRVSHIKANAHLQLAHVPHPEICIRALGLRWEESMRCMEE